MTAESLTGTRTTFAALLAAGGPLGLKRIEIPAIQRDFAQGRRDLRSTSVRESFLDAIAAALTGGAPVELDFVYGGTTSEGSFAPIDGQQRLTTLFLVHWFLACKTGKIAEASVWTSFEYATRPAARAFCKRLVDPALMTSAQTDRKWIEDQPWFMHTWRREPTIAAMLVMIDAIGSKLNGVDHEAAWERLVNETTPVVTFYALNIASLGSGEELYIKMNSRGKPLTPFEIFKARFEQVIPDADLAKRFASKADGPWSDMLWPLRGSDDVIDDEFLRYLHFIITILEFRDKRFARGYTLLDRAKALFGEGASDGPANLEFLFQALDVWAGVDTGEYFRGLFAPEAQWRDADSRGLVPLHGRTTNLDLFAACCDSFNGAGSYGRAFSLADMLMLYAVLLHRVYDTPDFGSRIRTVRNLVEASTNEIRLEAMPALLDDVEAIVVHGNLLLAEVFSVGQREEEELKAPMRDGDDELGAAMRRLEDHPLLRGSLTAFDFAAPGFQARALAFEAIFDAPKVWLALTGALLATGTYQRTARAGRYWFGTASAENQFAWRELLTGVQRRAQSVLRDTLGKVLDEVAANSQDPGTALAAISGSYLAECATSKAFDWRYYLVAYDEARRGASGRYATTSDEMGYELCMLDKTQLNSSYRDAYLSAIVSVAGPGIGIANPRFSGRTWNPRWLRTASERVSLRSVAEGFEVLTLDPDATAAVNSAAQSLGLDREVLLVAEEQVTCLLRVHQAEVDGRLVDSEDRVQIGARLLTEFVKAGL